MGQKAKGLSLKTAGCLDIGLRLRRTRQPTKGGHHAPNPILEGCSAVSGYLCADALSHGRYRSLNHPVQGGRVVGLRRFRSVPDRGVYPEVQAMPGAALVASVLLLFAC